MQGPFGNSYIYGGTTQNGQVDIPQQSSFTAPLEVIEKHSCLSILSINTSEMKLIYLSYRAMILLIVHCRSGETGLIAHLLVTNEGSVPGQGREKSSSCSFIMPNSLIVLAKQIMIIADVGQVLPEP